jgi:hypothetical protein
MHKIKYCIVCLSFLFACKNDQKQSEVEALSKSGSTNSSNNENSNLSSGDATLPAHTNNTPSNTSTRSDAVAPSDNVLSSGQTTNVPEPGSVPAKNSSTPPQLSKSSTNADDTKIVLGKSKASETYTTIMEEEKKQSKGSANLPIPDPCSLISIGTLNSNFDLTSSPEIKSGSKVPRPAEKSCFFKFGNTKKPNAGIMLQVMTNPYPDEIDDYPGLVIDGKIKDGEQSPYDKIQKKFKPWNELGDGGCYSFEAGKYHWKIGNKYIFLLAFNTDHTEVQQKQLASIIGKEIMKNFKANTK